MAVLNGLHDQSCALASYHTNEQLKECYGVIRCKYTRVIEVRLRLGCMKIGKLAVNTLLSRVLSVGTF